MYTQCPDCQTTFRVTARILQQAEGRVRCGGCSNAFNALEHLQEDEKSAGSGQTSTGSTSDQNEKLLETLEKLAGPDVTIEDTGVEWRVLGESDAEDAAADSSPMLGREEDIPRPVSESQESLDFEEDEPRYDDNTILPDDFGRDDDLDELPFLEKSESPKRRAGDREATQDNSDFEEAQVDLALGEPDEWEDLLDEFGEDEAVEEPEAELAAEAVEEFDSEEERPAEQAVGDEPTDEDMPSDIDTQFLMQAEEMGIDTGSHEIISEQDVHAAAEHADDFGGADVDEPGTDEDELRLEEDDVEDEEAASSETESTGEFEPHMAEDEPRPAAGQPKDESEESADVPAALELSEEVVATEGEKESETADDVATAIMGGEDVSKLFDEGSALVETIIMEGDSVGDETVLENKKAFRAAGAFKNVGALEDTYSLTRGKIRGGRRAGDPPSYTVIASVVVLVLLLVGQIMHQSRQSLATYGAFNHTIGSIYRVLGSPVTPDWDIKGWQFETTNGSVDEEANLLTIYSRIANKSEHSLPYPLVHISLTDRWEDVIGSRVLEPGQYLAGDLDPRKPVPPGENFTAVITIESPTTEATGFRLTPCYRIEPGRVRCATQDFKN
jgi:predicted Zn finger-like uncharacterized protein